MNSAIEASSSTTNPQLAEQVAQLAAAAGLQVVSQSAATSFAGAPTTRFELALAGGAAAQRMQLELSDSFDPAQPALAQPVATFLAESRERLRNPVPAALLTLGGIPLVAAGFAWPFHESTAGADTSLVHGQVALADGTGSPLHAKISASMTVTFREIVRAPEQPFAETFILNAVRKTFDQGQLELVKSGNRQPVPVTTRYFSSKQNRFIFNDTTEPERRAFLAAKTYWLSGVLGAQADGAPAPVWLLDPRDAQYLNCTVADLKVSLETLVREGQVVLAADPAFAAPSATLLSDKPKYDAKLADALAFIKPSFNEDMRAGNTNM